MWVWAGVIVGGECSCRFVERRGVFWGKGVGGVGDVER